MTISRETLRRLVADLGYPRIVVSPGTTLSRSTWDSAIADASTYQARENLLAVLEPALLAATPSGAERLRKWEPAEFMPAPSADDLRERAQLYGDLKALPILSDALLKCPAAVREAVLDEAAFIVVGLQSQAWTASAKRTDIDGRSRHREIVFGPAISVELALHEFAHVWHAPLPDDPAAGVGQAIRAIGEAALKVLDASWAAAFEKHEGRSERNADALAEIWMNRNSN